jgi:single-strand DNA-binding protein
MSVNKTILLGNVGGEPVIRSTQDGKKIATFSLATSEKWKDKSSNESREKTEWHRIVVFSEGLVGIIEKYVKKGSKLFVEGSLQTRKWTGNDGQEKYTTEIVLQGFNNKLEIIDNRKEGENNTSENYEGSSYGEPSGNFDINADIPF